MADKENDEPRFTIPMPGGRVARVPLQVLEQYVDADAQASHAHNPSQRAGGSSEPHKTELKAKDGMITINIYTASGQVRIEQHEGGGEEDVVAHHLAIDATTGTSDFHTDWEYGECEYTDESGFPQRIQAWHRHPFGTEYSELYEG